MARGCAACGAIVALEVITFRRGPFWNFSYLLACTSTGEAAVIDPAWDVAAILGEAATHGMAISAVVLTHAHSDHANGVAGLVAATGAAVFAHEAEASSLREHYAGAVEAVGDGARLRFGGVEARVLWTPGHSEGSLALLAEGRLFSGDTLLVGGVGRPGPGRESLEALWESARRLAALPTETLLHPGHDEGATSASSVGAELARGGAFTSRSFEEFISELERSTGRTHRH